MAVAISLSLFIFLLASISWFGYRVYSRRGQVYQQLREPALALGPAVESSTPTGAWVVRIIQLVGEKVPVSSKDSSEYRRRLLAAGFRTEGALSLFYGLKVLVCGLVTLPAAFGLAPAIPNPIFSKTVALALAFAAWGSPNLMLDKLVAKRRERLRLALPDALDLLVVCLEAGMVLDQAFLTVSRELRITHEDICDEFSLVNLEIRAGKRRADALNNLAERTGETELRKLVAILVQADRFGTGIAEALRIHSEFMRIRRRQEAEERAGKVGVKLVFPIFFCILPSMFIVTAGPGLLQILNYLLPMMRKF